MPRWAAWVIIAAGLAMFPRLVLLSPEGTQIGGRSLAWIGFGLVLSALLVRTGWLALRGREHMELSAAAAGTLLVAAVWFQVIMSGARSEVELAAAFAVLAVLAELPLAGVCLWIAGRAEFRRAERARIMIYLVQKLRRERAAESLRGTLVELVVEYGAAEFGVMGPERRFEVVRAHRCPPPIGRHTPPRSSSTNSSARPREPPTM